MNKHTCEVAGSVVGRSEVILGTSSFSSPHVMRLRKFLLLKNFCFRTFDCIMKHPFNKSANHSLLCLFIFCAKYGKYKGIASQFPHPQHISITKYFHLNNKGPPALNQ